MEAEYVRIQGKVNEIIENADCVAVISDRWSNIRGEGIINYIISTPQPVFFKSTDTKDKRSSVKLGSGTRYTIRNRILSYKV